jgi:hypothetical protein
MLKIHTSLNFNLYAMLTIQIFVDLSLHGSVLC